MEEVRALPAAVESEQALLGAMLLENSIATKTGLQVSDFYHRNHGELYRLIRHRVQGGGHVDSLTLGEFLLEKPGRTSKYGEIVYVTGLPERCPTTMGWREYESRILETAERRRIIVTANRAAHMAYHEPLDDVYTAMAGASQAKAHVGHTGNVTVRDEMGRAVAQFEDRISRISKGEQVGIPWGFKPMEAFQRTLEPGHFVLICGRPGQGKTELALTISLAMAERLKTRQLPGCVYFDSLEMTAGSLVQRLWSKRSGVSIGRIRYPSELSPDERGRLDSAELDLTQFGDRFVINDRAGKSIEQVRRCAHAAMVSAGGISAVFVDYVQLMEYDEKREVAELARISKGCLAMAKELACPVIGLAQLNRNCEDRADKRPQMSDIRGSGQFEQDADVIIGLYRDEYYNPDTTTCPGIVEATSLKSRHGKPRVSVSMGFRDGHFYELNRTSPGHYW